MLPYFNLNLFCILSQERERPTDPISIILTFIHIWGPKTIILHSVNKFEDNLPGHHTFLLTQR